jgi:hypothetical protein
MIVCPLIRSVGLKAATASSRDATLPMFVRSRPSRTRWTISPSWARSDSTTKSTARPSAGRASDLPPQPVRHRPDLLPQFLARRLDLVPGILGDALHQRCDMLLDVIFEVVRHIQARGSGHYYGYQYQDLHNRLPGLLVCLLSRRIPRTVAITANAETTIAIANARIASQLTLSGPPGWPAALTHIRMTSP